MVDKLAITKMNISVIDYASWLKRGSALYGNSYHYLLLETFDNSSRVVILHFQQ